MNADYQRTHLNYIVNSVYNIMKKYLITIMFSLIFVMSCWGQSAGDLQRLGSQLATGNTRYIQLGDSHDVVEADNKFMESIARNWPVPMIARLSGFTAGHNTTGFIIQYPNQSYYTKNDIWWGDLIYGGYWHGPTRTQNILWNINQPDSGFVARFKLSTLAGDTYANGDWYESQPIACKIIYHWEPNYGNIIRKWSIRTQRGVIVGPQIQIDYTGIMPLGGIYATSAINCPYNATESDPEISWRTDNTSYDETNKEALIFGALFFRHNGDFNNLGQPLSGFYLQSIAIPGAQTYDHAALTGPNNGHWYSNEALAEHEFATRLSITQQNVVSIMLGHDDGGTPVPSWKEYHRQIRDRYRTIFGPNTWILYIHPWYSPTTTLQKQQEQWIALQELVAEDLTGNSFAISIAEYTNYILYDGTNGHPDYLDVYGLHIEGQAGCDFIGLVTRDMIFGY